MNAHPEVSLGFFSAFLITWIFIVYPFSSRESGKLRYLRGSGSCSMMKAHPEVSLGFFSAFLIT
jgi:hypothetical protein